MNTSRWKVTWGKKTTYVSANCYCGALKKAAEEWGFHWTEKHTEMQAEKLYDYYIIDR